MSRRLAVAGLVAYLAVLAAVTLGASPGALLVRGADVARGFDGFGWVSTGDVERAANVLLFAPFGLLLCFALPGVSRLLVWLLCVAVSVSVEAAQVFLPGRQSAPVDVVTNATGAALGVLAHAAWTWWGRHRAGDRLRQ